MKKNEIFELILLSDLPLPEKQDVYDYINKQEKDLDIGIKIVNRQLKQIRLEKNNSV